MKKLTTLLFTIAFLPGLFAQSLERYVISSAGGSYFDGMSFQMDYTTGELVVNTLSNGSNIMTQGFQQPFVNTVVVVAENTSDPIIAELFPNPVYDQLNILISNAKEENYQVMLYDILGQLIMEEQANADFDGKTRIYFNTSGLATGSYYIRVMHEREILVTRKLIKVNQ
jgi:hypothetical protein